MSDSTSVQTMILKKIAITGLHVETEGIKLLAKFLSNSSNKKEVLNDIIQVVSMSSDDNFITVKALESSILKIREVLNIQNSINDENFIEILNFYEFPHFNYNSTSKTFRFSFIVKLIFSFFFFLLYFYYLLKLF
jgi:hypothetical protein